MKRLELVAVRHRIYSLALAALFAALILTAAAPRAAAQNDGGIAGTILDVDGKPWAELPIQLVSDQGAKQETKTDKDGNYVFRNLRAGTYHVYMVIPAPNKPFDSQCQVAGGNVTRVDLSFKDVIAKQGAAAQEAVKKQAEQKQAIEAMKTHFNAGSAFLDQEHQAKAGLDESSGGSARRS